MGAIYLISIRFHKGVQEFFSADRCDDIPSCFPSPKDYNRLLPFLLPSFPPTFSSSSSLDHNQRALQILLKLSSPRNNQTHKAPRKNLVKSETMAPPAVATDLPLPQRLMALAQTLQFGWFVGSVSPCSPFLPIIWLTEMKFLDT